MSRGEDTKVSRTIQTCRFLTVSILTIRGYVSYKNSNLKGGNNQTDTYTPARVIQLNGRILRMLSSGEKNKFFPAQEVGFLSNASQPAGQMGWWSWPGWRWDAPGNGAESNFMSGSSSSSG